MISVELSYKNCLGFTRTIKNNCPVRWSEMNEKQFLFIARESQGALHSDDQFFSEMFGIPLNVAKKLDSYYRFVLEGKAKYLREKRGVASHFFIPKLGRLHSPEEMLAGMSLQQFMTADTYFQQAYDDFGLAITPHLDMMISALYLSKKQAFSVGENDKKHKLWDLMENMRIVAREKADVKWAIFLNWSLILNWLSRAYPLLFPAPDEDDLKELKKGKAKKPKTSWLDVYDNFVGDDIAHSQAYQTMEATDAFRIMERRIRESNKSKIRRTKK